ncbi:AAA+-type ATPase [Scheffersomyces spartinae]|uniref:AAA+-type ATPase n=1 Tax=Scheffersomyces spartinae TaxID=45513 RepID=A0A9P7VAE0_9ASCO|nr:AAA+-type ATPase [Scheffersomyces spartinae]KAG7194366.1 AAA+-type ATPase [Scheffersomyces spartinae]
MSSKPSKKKSSSSSSASGAGDVAPQKKIKIPKNFITRPSSSTKGDDSRKVYINSQIQEAMELPNDSIVYIDKVETSEPGVLATVYGDDNLLDTNVITIPQSLRQLGGILLGDRLLIVKAPQPEYAKSVSIYYDDDNDEFELDQPNIQKQIQKCLHNVAIISPGLSFKIKLQGATSETILTIIDINEEDDIDTVDQSLQALSISNEENTNGSIISTTTSNYIFTTNTKIMKSKLKVPSSSKYPNIPHPMNYDQVGGLTKEISLLKTSVELPLHNPTLFSDFGISPPRGILLHGPPGTGKTLLLRCVANQTNAHVLTVSGPSIVSKYLGETEQAIRDIFIEARKFQPSIIFMDEIDSLVPNRNSDDSGETESRVVATLLTMMDGMGDSGRIVVIGATNRPNSIDPALRRPGRFDQEVEIGIPDVDARCDILKKQLGKMNPLKTELNEQDIEIIASKTHGYVGADLTALCREAVMIAINKGLKSQIPQSDIKVQLNNMEEALSEIRPSAMRDIFLEMPKVYWSDIGGQEQLKRKLVEVIQLPLEAKDAFARLGIKAPRGVLLYGPPGCSKTLTAKALATESGLNFLAVKGPEILNKYVGESEKTIREIFRKAKAASPSIIFFDEIDAISSSRDSGESTSSAAQNVLTTLLNELDGVEELNGVIVVAATNRPTDIDAALLRPGRLDRHVYVSPPNYEARLEILNKRCQKFNLDGTVDLLKIAKETEGCSGAEVALLCQEAGLAAIRENKEAKQVLQEHFDQALSSITKNITHEMLEYYEEFSTKNRLKI